MRGPVIFRLQIARQEVPVVVNQFGDFVASGHVCRVIADGIDDWRNVDCGCSVGDGWCGTRGEVGKGEVLAVVRC